MKPMPRRLILQVFTNDKWNLSDEQLAQLREVAQLSVVGGRDAGGLSG